MSAGMDNTCDWERALSKIYGPPTKSFGEVTKYGSHEVHRSFGKVTKIGNDPVHRSFDEVTKIGPMEVHRSFKKVTKIGHHTV